MLCTQIASSSGALTWMFSEWAVRKKPSLQGVVSGSIAGLVCVTPASGFINPSGAFFIGFLSGPACYFGAQFKHYLGLFQFSSRCFTDFSQFLSLLLLLLSSLLLLP